MTREDFKEAFLLGAYSRGPITPNDGTINYLLDVHYDDKEHIRALQDMIATMNDIARDYIHHVKCRSCGEDYDMPVELSEFDPEYSYCGGQWCCP